MNLCYGNAMRAYRTKVTLGRVRGIRQLMWEHSAGCLSSINLNVRLLCKDTHLWNLNQKLLRQWRFLLRKKRIGTAEAVENASINISCILLMGIFGWNLKLFAWCSVQLLSKLPLCLKFTWLNSYTVSTLGTWSEERGRTAIVMQMQKVEATQERRDEPRGSITLVFHHGPESICLKIKRGRTPLRSALRGLRTSHATSIIQPVFVYLERELPSAKPWVTDSCQQKDRGQRKETVTDPWIAFSLARRNA